VLDEMVSPCKPLVASPPAIWNGARIARSADAVDRRLMTLEVSESGEVGRRRAIGNFALPSSDETLVSVRRQDGRM
jgi:hypothetical protein